jgi:hypothetical protein
MSERARQRYDQRERITESRGYVSGGGVWGRSQSPQKAKRAERFPVQPGGVQHSRRWFNLHSGPLLVAFQGRNFHQGPFRVGVPPRPCCCVPKPPAQTVRDSRRSWSVPPRRSGMSRSTQPLLPNHPVSRRGPPGASTFFLSLVANCQSESHIVSELRLAARPRLGLPRCFTILFSKKLAGFNGLRIRGRLGIDSDPQ